MKLVERHFWAVCLAAVLLGLFLPQLGMPIARIFRFLLGVIIFFTALKLDLSSAWRELRRPWLVIYATAMMMLVLPLCVYGIARLALPPALAVGVLIVAAMPAGAACSSLTDVVGGNAALALVGTLLTSLVCPLTAPWIIGLGAGGAQAGAGGAVLLRQAAFLAVVIIVPLVLAFAARRAFPAFVSAHRGAFTGLSILALGAVILGAMAAVSADFKTMVRTDALGALRLFGFMCGFSAAMHLAGYFLAPWRPLADRAALSINTAYVNNGLAMAFAAEFFRPLPELGAAAVLPAILLEAPMDLALVPLKAWVTRRNAAAGAPVADAAPGGQ